MHLREPTEWFVTEKRTGEMEPEHDHSTGIICHLPEELSEQPTGKGVNSQVLQVTYIVSSASVLLLWPRQSHCLSAISRGLSPGHRRQSCFFVSSIQTQSLKEKEKKLGWKEGRERYWKIMIFFSVFILTDKCKVTLFIIMSLKKLHY